MKLSVLGLPFSNSNSTSPKFFPKFVECLDPGVAVIGAAAAEEEEEAIGVAAAVAAEEEEEAIADD